MHIISRKALREFWERHPEAEDPLQNWYRIASHAEWKNLAELPEFAADRERMRKQSPANRVPVSSATQPGPALAMVLDGRRTDREPDRDFYVAFNASREPMPFTVAPAPQGRPWRRVVDTALASPLDIVAQEEAPMVPEWSRYTLAAFSLVVLMGEG